MELFLWRMLSLLWYPLLKRNLWELHTQHLLVAVIVVVVIAAQRREEAQANGIGEEDLSACIHPHLKTKNNHDLDTMHSAHRLLNKWLVLGFLKKGTLNLWIGKAWDVGVEVVVDTIQGPREGNATDEESQQRNIGECSCEVCSLQNKQC